MTTEHTHSYRPSAFFGPAVLSLRMWRGRRAGLCARVLRTEVIS